MAAVSIVLSKAAICLNMVINFWPEGKCFTCDVSCVRKPSLTHTPLHVTARQLDHRRCLGLLPDNVVVLISFKGLMISQVFGLILHYHGHKNCGAI